MTAGRLTFLTALILGVLVPTTAALAAFGFKTFSYSTTDRNGLPTTQAGSHPWALTTTFSLNGTTLLDGERAPDGDVKDTDVEPPLGLVGNPTATQKCSLQQFTTPPSKEALPEGSSYVFAGADCPNNSQVGIADVELGEGDPAYIGVYNLVAPSGVPAEFGFNYLGEPVLLTATLRNDGTYGLTVHARGISQTLHVFGVKVILWGDPADPGHDEERGECLGTVASIPAIVEGGCPAGTEPKPFLTLPTTCPGGPLTMTIRADPWQDPGAFVSAESPNVDSHGNQVPITGCGRLPFSPSLTIQPANHEANAPTGLEADLTVPQNENPAGVAESQVRDVSVTLPSGMVVNPSAAEGREACTPAQIDLNHQSEAACPDASKIGTVIARTPLLEEPLEGSVYLAQQEANPFGSLLALYLVAENKTEGVHVKLAGQIHADPDTGQLTTTFDGNRLYGAGAPLEGEPQLPFNDLRLRFFGGPRAALMNPGCGTYTPSSLFTPWSGTPAVAPAMGSFTLAGDCGTDFNPGLVSGTTVNQASAYSPLVTTVSRADSDQPLGQVSVKLPPGVLGMLSHVTLCGAVEAQTGSCPSTSQVGHLNATAGAGPDPVSLPQPGKREDPVFLTGPYQDAPFGLSILVHAEAGPFDLGDLVVRAGIHVDPVTAQVTVVTDALPRILRGIPLDVRSASVTVDRAGGAANQFAFNPTNCTPLALTGTVASTLGVTTGVSGRFQAANCATLPFHPSFRVATAGRASKANGASLEVNVSSKGGPQPGGGEANIRSVRVELPKQLPARLTTLQRACVASVFEANPASCPKESDVGWAKAITPVLAHPLTGPAYLVSHGGAAFPDLEVVLQGEGIQLVLDGHTDIKKGVTISDFNTVPDAPVSSFSLRLPAGKFSILSANVPAKNHFSLCGQKLSMPTVITAQNGAVLKQTTRIAVTGCAQAKKAKQAKTAGNRRSHPKRYPEK